ncbi:hypothetical protein MOO45_03915 [Bombilactobacillus folatiphilus]|uniref:CHAD domain-containing protein n=1 Tax=Bombilactobacillus folatiphilus TaxID=2923362 RepID=A0ABY4PC11_9LACO|nr:hypothetical protein [Bombilactobacillus folatiphilus]UQS82797.1 hypothetical protein MOO45_03915 [Bombilactobacillus folatiphilus]
MKKINNNDKILHLIAGYQQLKQKVPNYLEKLHHYQEQQNQDQKLVNQLRQQLLTFNRQLPPATKKVDDVKKQIKGLRTGPFKSYRQYRTYGRKNVVDLLENLIQEARQVNLAEKFVSPLQVLVEQLAQLDLSERPQAGELVTIIHAIRHRNMYIKRGYQILKYVQPVYQALTNLRTALVQGAKYLRTLHAWQKYQQAFQNLDKYYRMHYVQAGGRPRNYHGHRSGEHN